ncbi:hypothetical protein MMC10_010220 [Thelotrema lepadinum]|nr:hypothetical protein [Thelotrema lepadinum]
MVEHNGLGQHQDVVLVTNPQGLIAFAENELVFTTFYLAAQTFPKLVLLTMFLRIFTTKLTRSICYILIVLSTLYGVIGIICNWTICIPIAALWDPTITNAQCFDRTTLWEWGGLPNVLLDSIVLFLPMPTLMKLHLPLRDRIGLILTFTTYGAATAAAATKVAVYINTYNPNDNTRNGIVLAIVSIIEMGTYMITICLPSLRPLYLHLRGKDQYSKRQRGTHTDGTTARLRTKNSTFRLQSLETARPSNMDQASQNSVSETDVPAIPQTLLSREEPGIHVMRSYSVDV